MNIFRFDIFINKFFDNINILKLHSITESEIDFETDSDNEIDGILS